MVPGNGTTYSFSFKAYVKLDKLLETVVCILDYLNDHYGEATENNLMRYMLEWQFIVRVINRPLREYTLVSTSSYSNSTKTEVHNHVLQ